MCFILLFSFGSVDNNFSTTNGEMIGFYGPGMLVFSMAVWVVNFKILSISNQFHFLNIFVIIGSMVVYVFVFWIVGFIFKGDITGLFSQ